VYPSSSEGAECLNSETSQGEKSGRAVAWLVLWTCRYLTTGIVGGLAGAQFPDI
jgi:hypothetical protein